MTTDSTTVTTYAAAMAQAERDVDATIDVYLSLIDLRQRINAMMDDLDADAAALDLPDDAGARQRRNEHLLAETVRMRTWRTQWLAALAGPLRRLYAPLDPPASNTD
jgi:hypothetical protein